HHIGEAVGHPGIGGEAIAPRPAGLLVIGFEVLRHIEMSDKTNVGLIDPHAEGDGRDDHHALVLQEALLVTLAYGPFKSSMVGKCVASTGSEPSSGGFDGAPGKAIDDAGVAGVVFGKELPKLLERIELGVHPVEQIRTVIAGCKDPCGAEPELRDDVAACRP